ncbi:hypothetical protein CARUB_v100127680mg, partial [Capsella rubella]
GLGLDVWDKLKNSSLGVFIKLAELEYTWSANRVHFFLTHQLAINNIHEVWSLIDGRPIIFSLNKFSDITRLNCDPFDVSENFDGDHHEFWKEMKIGTTTEGPMFNELLNVIDFSKAWSLEKRLMVGRLCLLSVCVHGIHSQSRIPLSTAKRVLDPVAFEKYPWGRVAFTCLMNSIKVVNLEKASYTIHGCVHALLIWIWVYESVPLLDWRSSRKNIVFQNFIKKEKENHGQIRVRHMVPVSEETMYPQWCDTTENTDPDLDKLIKDIINNRLSLDAWECAKTGDVCLKKRKRKVADKENENCRSSPRKKRMNVTHSEKDEGTNVINKTDMIREEHMDDAEQEKKSMLDIWRAIEKVNGTISKLGKSLSRRLDELERKFETVVEKTSERIKIVETELKDLKEAKPTDAPDDAISIHDEDDEGNSKQP